LLTPLDSQIIASGSESDFDTYLGLRCSKKHCCKQYHKLQWPRESL